MLAVVALQSMSQSARGQDIHFSQFYETALLRNPSLVGLFAEDYKVSAQYRTQWASLSQPYRTMQLGFETHFPVGRDGKNYLAAGVQGYSDKAGRIAMATTGVYGSVSYNQSLSSNRITYLSLGFVGGTVSKRLDPSKMTFDNQYNGGGGTDGVDRPQLNYFDLGAGLSLNGSFDEEGNYTYVFGVGAYHFTKPSVTYFIADGAVPLAPRWTAQGATHLSLSDSWSTWVYADVSIQGKSREIIGGGLLRWAPLNELAQRNIAISAGGFYRFGDAIAPTVKVEWRGQSLGASYDVNISELKVGTQMRGGLELSACFKGFWRQGYNDRKMCPRL